jgi:hypothetical protein
MIFRLLLLLLNVITRRVVMLNMSNFFIKGVAFLYGVCHYNECRYAVYCYGKCLGATHLHQKTFSLELNRKTGLWTGRGEGNS